MSSRISRWYLSSLVMALSRARSRRAAFAPKKLAFPSSRDNHPYAATTDSHPDCRSPHTRGAEPHVMQPVREIPECSPRVGLNRPSSSGSRAQPGVPRARGAEPTSSLKTRNPCRCSPHVGLNRTLPRGHRRSRGVPHARGAEPTYLSSGRGGVWCSPHAWG